MLDSLPIELIKRIKEIYTDEELKILENWFTCETRKTSFRINTLKSSTKEVLEELKENNLEVEKIKFLKNWYILLNWKEEDLWKLNIFNQWKIYMQSISSQLPVDLLDLEDFHKVLDVTAAPGWKTSQASALLKNTWEIIANDNNQIRIDKLNFTLKKQWCKNVKVIKTDARLIATKNAESEDNSWYINYFNHIIADLPCSAEWKINVNKEKSFWYWDLWVVKRNFKLQKQILNSIIPMLKVWWTLMYSTCTLAPEENEAVVHMILSLYPSLQIQEINIDNKNIKQWILSFWKHVYRKDVAKSIRILPSEETEWFFIAKFKRVS